MMKCRFCKGTGKALIAGRPCSTCEGTGSVPDNRQRIIDAYWTLMDTIGLYERGRVEKSACKKAFDEYSFACFQVAEPEFILDDIMSDDMAEIPSSYPETPAKLPTHANYFDTKRAQARRAILADRLKSEL